MGGRKLGALSLCTMAAGFAVTRTLQAFGGLSLASVTSLDILRNGFEAGLVGGLADWYAVTVLFRRAPRPLRWVPVFDTHSRLLVKNRQRITDNVVTLVEEEWLTPEALRMQLEHRSIAEVLCARLRDPTVKDTVISSIAEIVASNIDLMTSTPVVSFVEKVIKDQLANANLATVIGAWIERTIQSGQHAPLWELLFSSLERIASDPVMHSMLQDKLQQIAQSESATNLWKRLAIKAGEAIGLIDYETVAASILTQLRTWLATVRDDPNSEPRQKINAYLLNLAHDLQTPGSEATRKLDGFRDALVADIDFLGVIRHVMGQAASTVQADLRNPSGHLRLLMSGLLDRSIAALTDNPEYRARLDVMLRDAVIEFVTKNRALIGEAVRHSFSKLSDEDLVAQIEPKVADDLQYIRLNGAVIGFLVGIAIALATLLARRL